VSSDEVIKNVHAHVPVRPLYTTLNQSVAVVVHAPEGSGKD